ncbi:MULTISPECIES: hypothetical protein [Pantoea]|uniref:Rap1a immunity protein domain-containing protein n=1 Tax=Candidatus Pantoea gossypiicola TaxID=2608008 RepID=A0AB34CLT6_9GAMM|nr:MULTISPECIES: hypothetical protein [Pantoea]KAA5931529.1 hypothetical protein F3I59_05495 [Pantoea sp. VH_8]KAA5957766.1 hypothetical protein F3I53_16075 [Pantoea sp. VH_16]KAA5987934.1 hypothetical protein F3I49_05415 [Pantoea sp. M_4]KAA6104676.1 hypothetical protein F3I25_16375 [Pantoea sp. Bo_14]KAA6108052.1 hypothetical protein F3I23_15410 [Pantoea sp. Bo_11]
MRKTVFRSVFISLALMSLSLHAVSAMTLEKYVDIRSKAYDINNKDNQSAKVALVFYLEGVAEGEGYSRMSDVVIHREDKSFKPYACVPDTLLMNDKLVNQFIELYLAGENPDMKLDVAAVYSNTLRRMYPCK